jgi:hypothetical protein
MLINTKNDIFLQQQIALYFYCYTSRLLFINILFFAKISHYFAGNINYYTA